MKLDMKKILIKYLKYGVEEVWWLLCPILMFVCMWYGIDDHLAAHFRLMALGDLPFPIVFGFGAMVACISNLPSMIYEKLRL